MYFKKYLKNIRKSKYICLNLLFSNPLIKKMFGGEPSWNRYRGARGTGFRKAHFVIAYVT